MSHPIKTVLVVGLGSAGRRHVGIIKELFPDINIVVLRHRQCDKNDIDALGLYKCVTSIDQAIEINPHYAATPRLLFDPNSPVPKADGWEVETDIAGTLIHSCRFCSANKVFVQKY